jgi:hypothetical protein
VPAATTDPGAPRALTRRRRLVRWGLGTGGGLLILTAAIGLLHTPWARPLLARIGGCPVSRVSAAQADALRLRGLARTLTGSRPAPLRPALGFALDRTTAADVTRWAATARVACRPKHIGLLTLHCAGVPRAALPTRDRPAGAVTAELPATIEDLAFTFSPTGRLVSVDAFTRSVPAGEARAAYAAATADLGAALGAPTDEAGGAAPESLALFAGARRRYRFSDYAAILSLSRLPSGLAVREQYLSGG